jgi:alpha-L-fucosidase 2
MVKKIALLIAAFSFIKIGSAQVKKDLSLWYNKPAAVWTEALPIGNGTFGAMVFGGAAEELIQLNEATLWSGGPLQTTVNPSSPQYLQPLRDALFKSDYATADVMAHKMQGLYSESYMPLGDLIIKQSFSNNKVSNYYRDLNIQDAIATTKYSADGVQYKREIFSSAPDKVMVIRISADKAKQLNINVVTKSQLKYNIETVNDILVLKGKAPVHVEPSYHDKQPSVVYADTAGCRGMRFELLVKATSKDGEITNRTDGIYISNASEIVFYITTATSFNGYDKCPDKDGKDEHQLANAYLNKALLKNYPALLQAHLADYHRYFNRVSLILNKENKTALPTDERLVLYRTGANDAGLEALYFQYGRYLLISCSRTPNVPANLQGIWNKELRPPWSSNYTTNINLQMNYWPVESTNLPELHQPLFDLLKELSVTGKRTAKEFYNINQGWVLNHNSDIWAMSNPVGDVGNGDPKWANWVMGANWLSRHLWEHYLYTGDKKFLQQTAYPLMKGAAAFTLQWLVPDSSGHWVTAPSTSPENDYYDGDKQAAISISSTMDIGIVRDLFNNIIAAQKVLNYDKLFTDSLKDRLSKFYPFQIGSKGNLQEWYKDFADVDPHHRHTSHLYALYPAKEISPLTTPALAAAAKKTLELRGDDGTGWALAWKVNMWARLLDGDHAYILFRNLLRLTKENDTRYNSGGGAYPNLFDAHPPFQIDGNFAGTAGITEMLLQSQDGDINLLPALPAAWQSGKVTGLKARGNYTVDIEWTGGQLVKAVIHSFNGKQPPVRVKSQVMKIDGKIILFTK